MTNREMIENLSDETYAYFLLYGMPMFIRRYHRDMRTMVDWLVADQDDVFWIKFACALDKKRHSYYSR